LTSTSSEKVRVLLVEDAIDHALLVQAFLAGLPGAAVTHSQDGDQALRLLESERWDLVVADLNVPGADGFEVIRAAKAVDRHRPVLATTGYTQEHYWDQAFRAGADQVMVKPLEREDFLNRVRTLLGLGPSDPRAGREGSGREGATRPPEREGSPAGEAVRTGRETETETRSGPSPERDEETRRQERALRDAVGDAGGEVEERKPSPSSPSGPSDTSTPSTRSSPSAPDRPGGRSGARETVLVVEGLLGDSVMGCGGVCAASIAHGAQVVVLPVQTDPPQIDPGAFGAAGAAARTLGTTLRLAESLVGDAAALELMLTRAVRELRPSTVYAPARGDGHPSRAAAHRIAVQAARGQGRCYGYQTATSPLTFAPRRVFGIADVLELKLEALSHFTALGATRPDLDPELARAYARYWGRLKEFGEVEAFEIIQEKPA